MKRQRPPEQGRRLGVAVPYRRADSSLSKPIPQSALLDAWSNGQPWTCAADKRALKPLMGIVGEKPYTACCDPRTGLSSRERRRTEVQGLVVVMPRTSTFIHPSVHAVLGTERSCAAWIMSSTSYLRQIGRVVAQAWCRLPLSRAAVASSTRLTFHAFEFRALPFGEQKDCALNLLTNPA